MPVQVKIGEGQERLFEIELGSSITSIILHIVAGERGCRFEDLVLLREGDNEPVSEAILITAEYPPERRHHVHHLGEVEATVYYQAHLEKKAFKRDATIDDVLIWAIKSFKIDPNMASEFELTRHGKKGELPGSEHIGHLAGSQHELALDLVRGDIANGCGS
jgi:hypothetical protein